MSGDSSDLEALFDSIADGKAPVSPPVSVPASVPSASSSREVGDSDDLQALFDSVAAEVPAQQASAESTSAGEEDWGGQQKVFQRVGSMARQLHDTLRELGYDKMISQTVEALPDAKDRLAYIANLTEQAACKVLNATDVANPLIESLEVDAQGLAQRWDRVYANQMGVDEFKQLAADTRLFLSDQLPKRTGGAKTQLMEIMMAQDF